MSFFTLSREIMRRNLSGGLSQRGGGPPFAFNRIIYISKNHQRDLYEDERISGNYHSFRDEG